MTDNVSKPNALQRPTKRPKKHKTLMVRRIEQQRGGWGYIWDKVREHREERELFGER